MWIPVRHDQLILVGIAGLLAVTVVFATGVERGKRLVRTERLLLPPRTREIIVPLAASETPRQTTAAKPAVVKPAAVKPLPATPKVKTPVKTASGASRYAIQVVTFSRPTLAKKELARLHARGERAFLVMRNGRTVVYVGPFPSKSNASEKLSTLKPIYQDCFLRTL